MLFKCSGSIILMDILVACTFFLPGRLPRSGLTETPFSERIFNRLSVSRSTFVFEFRIVMGIDRTDYYVVYM